MGGATAVVQWPRRHHGSVLSRTDAVHDRINDPMPPSLQVMAPVSASSDYHGSWIYHTGGVSLWGWMAPYAIFKGLHTLKRLKRNDLFEKMKEYVEGGEFPLMRQTRFGLNAFTPLTEKWYRHLPIKDWGEILKEAAPASGAMTALYSRSDEVVRYPVGLAPDPHARNLEVGVAPYRNGHQSRGLSPTRRTPGRPVTLSPARVRGHRSSWRRETAAQT